MGRVAGTLDPKAVDILFGPVKLEGYAEGEFITISQEEDTFLKVVGTDGEVARSINYNDATIITVKLLQTSLSNTLLSGLWQLDKATGGGSPQTFFIRDRSGVSIFASATAWVVKPPDQSWDKQATSREWAFCAVGQPPTNSIGGN